MPLYDYRCPTCNRREERAVRLSAIDIEQLCGQCGEAMQRQISPVYGRMAGQVLKGGGPDRFTADTMGIPLKDLPAHLKADTPPK